MDDAAITAMAEHGEDWWQQARADIIVDLVGSVAAHHMPIIDIGAGSGFVAKRMLDAGHFPVVCFDKSDEAIRLMQEDGLDARRYAFPYHGKAALKLYGVVLCLDVLEHIRRDGKALWQIANSMVPDSVLILTVPMFDFLWTKKDEDVGHYRRYSMRQLQMLCCASGLSMEYCTYFNFFLFPLALAYALLNKRKTRVARYRKRGNRLLRWIFALERHIIRRRWRMPWGVSALVVLRKA